MRTHEAFRTTARSVAVCAIALGLLAAGCSSASDSADSDGQTIDTTETGQAQLTYLLEPEGDPVAGGLLAFGLNAETDGWNASSNRWAASGYIVANTIFDPLAFYDKDASPQPYLAESFEHNDDYTVWTITLRDGPTFHDGTPVDADAIVQNLQAHQASILTSTAMARIEPDGVRAVDPFTVEIQMVKPWASFPLLLTAQPGYVMAPSMLEDVETGTRNPVGSGPFTFESWRPNADLKVKKYADYWREGLPYLDNVEFTVFADVQTRGRALETGQMDAIETTDARQIEKYAAEAKAGQLQMYADDNAEQSETFIALNTKAPPFDDPLARQILAFGTNTQELSNAAYGGIFPPARGMFSEDSPYWIETEYPEYDLAKATELHERWKAEHNGEPLSFQANITPSPEIQLIAQTLQQQAAEAGVEVQLNAIDQATLVADAVSGNYEATGFILFGAPDPQREYVFFTDDPPGSILNITGNENDAIVEAIDAARSTEDRQAQIEAFHVVQQEMAEDLNFIWLVHNLSAIVFDNSVFGLADTSFPDGEPMLRTMTPFLTETYLVSES